MSHGDEVTAAPNGFVVTGRSAGAPVAAFEDVGRGLAGVQFHPEVLHTAARPADPAALPVRHRRHPPAVDRGQHHRRARSPDSRSGRREAGDLRPLRWRRLGGGGGVGPAGGRRSAHLRLRRPRAASGRGGRAGRARLRRRHRRAAEGGRGGGPVRATRSPEWSIPRTSARSSGGSSFACSRRPPARSSKRPARPGPPSIFSCRGRCTRTWSSLAAAPAPRTSRATTTSVDCRTTCNSLSSSRCATCSRTRCAGSASSWACRPRSSGGSRSPVPAWASASSERSPLARLAVLRRADAIARAELSAAGLDRDIWQCPVVLLATVRSVGVQGDGRTYGHPVVLRPVSSEDAMTADWTRRALRRARADLHPHHERGARDQPDRPGPDVQAPGHDRVGVAGQALSEQGGDQRTRGERGGGNPDPCRQPLHDHQVIPSRLSCRRCGSARVAKASWPGRCAPHRYLRRTRCRGTGR